MSNEQDASSRIVTLPTLSLVNPLDGPPEAPPIVNATARFSAADGPADNRRENQARVLEERAAALRRGDLRWCICLCETQDGYPLTNAEVEPGVDSYRIVGILETQMQDLQTWVLSNGG